MTTETTQAVGAPLGRHVRPHALVYALQAPSGALVPETVTHDRRQAWCKAFDFLCSIDPQYAHKYWKRWDASQRAARRRGWRVVRAALVTAA